MLKMKIGGILLTGFSAWLLINKGMNLVSQISRDARDAAQWKAYYKYGKEDAVPPGYRVTKRTENGKDVERTVEEDKSHVSVNASEGAIQDAVKKAINTIFEGIKREEGASEASEEASEEDNPSEADNVVEFPVKETEE